MRRMSPEETKECQIDILDFVHEFCERNNIKYWLDCGTLLGAVRHGGYIPWDDDIDIGMLREDYEKFISTFNNESQRYACYNIENNPEFEYPFAKVLDTETVLYEPDESGLKLYVNIDIFIYDNAPDDPRLQKAMFKKRDKYVYCRYFRYSKGKASGGIFKKISVKIMYSVLKHFPVGYFEKKIIKNARKYEAYKTSLMGNFTGTDRFVCDKSCFRECIWMEFEGKSYRAPIEYDKYLKALYNDYMQLPPEEKRVSHHSYIAYSNY